MSEVAPEPLWPVEDEGDASLLDLVDHLLDKGCVLSGSVILGLADVDLIYLELKALLCGIDHVQPRPEE
jgi:hypothetical protein